MRAVALAGTLLLWALGAAVTAAAQAPASEDCLVCHQDPGLQRSDPGPGRPASLFVDPTIVAGSKHAALPCVACHKTATAPHEPRLPRVVCAECHDQARADLANAVHAPPRPGSRAATRRAPAGAPPAPTCTSCHGTHAVGAAADLGAKACATCHKEVVATYRASVHGISRERPDSEAASCRSCHGETHAILAAKDPQAPTYHLNLPRTCARCHADPELVKRNRITAGNAYKLYLDSIHGRAVTRSGLLVAANCSDCHGTHEIRVRTDPASRVFRSNVPQTCATCHAGVLAEFAESVHGQALHRGNPKAPVCIDCHSAHEIQRVEATPWAREVIRECGTCHEESFKTYRDTFHGKVTALGGFGRVAKCADCHGAHTTQPASDPRSQVAPGNIVATCARCHPGATPAFAQFDPHADPHQKDRFPELYYPYMFMTGLLIAVFGFFGVHTLLWLPRSLVERLARGRRPSEEGREP